jgi:NAD+ synthase (glutamine-hydrolysing)
MVDLNERILEGIDADGHGAKLSTLNKENIQAKIRGTTMLSNIASKYGALMTNNGNKLEAALNYATLYGDVNGALAPIADLLKTEVFMMGKYLNEHIYHDQVLSSTLFPDELFRFKKDQIIPSAELKEDQIDPMKFGYHDALLEAYTDYRKKSVVDVMRWYVDGTLEKNLNISTALIKRWNIDDPKEFLKDLKWFTKSVQSSFKRAQTCMNIMTSKSAFGYDIRESILPYHEYEQEKALKEHIQNYMERYRTKE